MKIETIYNHTLATNSFEYKKQGLERVDIQLINMFKDAKERLEKCDINKFKQVKQFYYMGENDDNDP